MARGALTPVHYLMIFLSRWCRTQTNLPIMNIYSPPAFTFFFLSTFNATSNVKAAVVVMVVAGAGRGGGGLVPESREIWGI